MQAALSVQSSNTVTEIKYVNTLNSSRSKNVILSNLAHQMPSLDKTQQLTCKIRFVSRTTRSICGSLQLLTHRPKDDDGYYEITRIMLGM